MIGVICTRHLVTHGHIIAHEFGLRTYLRCWIVVLTRTRCTFLEIVSRG